jgi:hypothetical protein
MIGIRVRQVVWYKKVRICKEERMIWDLQCLVFSMLSLYDYQEPRHWTHLCGEHAGGNAPPLKLSLYWQLPNVQRGWHSPDLGGPYSIRVIVADLGMVGKEVSGLCR